MKFIFKSYRKDSKSLSIIMPSRDRSKLPGPRTRLEIKRMLKEHDSVQQHISTDEVLSNMRVFLAHAHNNMKTAREDHEARAHMHHDLVRHQANE
jgi:hypothetical protein